MADRPAFTCPRCGRTSYHPSDVEEGYCGYDHDWTRGDLEDGLLAQRTLDDGRHLGVEPLLFSRARLTVGTAEQHEVGCYEDAYDYDFRSEAFLAFVLWDGVGEPEGWVRHKPSNRRRPGGDPAQEHVRP